VDPHALPELVDLVEINFVKTDPAEIFAIAKAKKMLST
jgi:hypothetical protein